MKKYTLVNHDTGEQKHYTKAEFNGTAMAIFLLGGCAGFMFGTILKYL